jgi:hypothetical protein
MLDKQLVSTLVLFCQLICTYTCTCTLFEYCTFGSTKMNGKVQTLYVYWIHSYLFNTLNVRQFVHCTFQTLF